MGASSVMALLVGQRMGLIPMFILLVFLLAGSVLIAQKSGFIERMTESQERELGSSQQDAFAKVNTLRRDLAGAGGVKVESGYLADADISTPAKAAAFLPLGVTYLLLAPFPWMFRNIRQAITLPEMIVWWYLIPSLIRGMIYGVKNRFSYISAPLLFCTGLTLMYGIFLGNVGTAYRQRTQIFIFYFIFISAGLLLKKKKADAESH